MTRLERLDLRTDDGVDLAAWFTPSHGPARAGVVVAHGFVGGGVAAHVVEHTTPLAEAGYDVLTYDARGHGDSGGRCTLGADERHDVAAAAREMYALRRPVVIVGESMGATACLGYAVDADLPVAGVVTVGSPAAWTMKFNLATAASALLTRTSLGRRVLSNRLDVDVHPEWLDPEPPESLVTRLELPLAVIHGSEDRFIPRKEAFRLHRRAAGPRRMMLVPRMAHGLGSESVRPVVAAVDWVLENARTSVPEPA